MTVHHHIHHHIHRRIHHTAYPLIPRIAMLLSLLVVFVGIYVLPDTHSTHVVFVQLCISLFAFMLLHIEFSLIFLFVYTLGTFLFITHLTIPKRHKTLRHALYEAVHIAGISGFVSIVIGYMLIYGFGVLNVYFVARTASVISGNDAIVRQIEASSVSPNILETSYADRDRKVVSLYLENGETGRFFKDSVIRSVLGVVSIDLSLPKRSLLLVGNTLLVAELNVQDLMEVSPTLGYVLVHHHFSPRHIRSYPDVTVLGRQDYLKLRENEIDTRLTKIDQTVELVRRAIFDDLGYIQTDNEKITSNVHGRDASIKERDAEHLACIQHEFPDDYCRNEMQKWDTLIAAWEKNITDWTNQLNNDKQLLASDQQYLVYLADTRSTIADQKDQIPDELGIFEGDSGKIYIALDWGNSTSVFTFIETLTHEYLHYASYVSKDTELPTFFEEGLTEYFARKIMKQEQGKDIAVGYPLNVEIIRHIAEKIPDTVLSDIYFTKDQDRLVSELNTAYGERFYEKHATDFSLLSYLSGEKAVDLANVILAEME